MRVIRGGGCMPASCSSRGYCEACLRAVMVWVWWVFGFLVVGQVRMIKGLGVQEHDEVQCVEPHEVIRLLKLAGAHRTRLPSPPHTYASLFPARSPASLPSFLPPFLSFLMALPLALKHV